MALRPLCAQANAQNKGDFDGLLVRFISEVGAAPTTARLGRSFVMNTKPEVLTAAEDFQQGCLGTIPTEMPDVHLAPTTPASTGE